MFSIRRGRWQASGVASLTDDTGPAAVDDVADEADLLGLGGAELAPCQGELARLGVVADDLGEALQRADVGGQADLDLLWSLSASGFIVLPPADG